MKLYTFHNTFTIVFTFECKAAGFYFNGDMVVLEHINYPHSSWTKL